jgi:hypothetical protein
MGEITRWLGRFRGVAARGLGCCAWPELAGWHPGGRVVPAPFVDADEEHAQRAQPVRDRGRVTAGLFWPGRAASQGLNASTCRRVTWASPVTAGAASARNAAKHRKARSVFTTLRGRSTQVIYSR